MALLNARDLAHDFSMKLIHACVVAALAGEMAVFAWLITLM